MKEVQKNKQATAIAKDTAIRISPRKLQLLAGMIRGLKVYDAGLQLRFSKKAAAQHVLKVLNSAVANAEHNNGMDVDLLYIKEVYCGKSITMKRYVARARGRGNRINKFFSNLTIILSERSSYGAKG